MNKAVEMNQQASRRRTLLAQGRDGALFAPSAIRAQPRKERLNNILLSMDCFFAAMVFSYLPD
jgi:hypothetical protein